MISPPPSLCINCGICLQGRSCSALAVMPDRPCKRARLVRSRSLISRALLTRNAANEARICPRKQEMPFNAQMF